MSPPGRPKGEYQSAKHEGTPMSPRDFVEARLREALEPSVIEVRDDSHLHAGHAGAREGGHYAVTIRSARFNGLSTLARHRLVYDSLGPLAPLGIHALAIDAKPSGDD